MYTDIDSVFLKERDPWLEDFESANEILRRETGLPISLENYCRFLVLLELEAYEKMHTLLSGD